MIVAECAYIYQKTTKASLLASLRLSTEKMNALDVELSSNRNSRLQVRSSHPTRRIAPPPASQLLRQDSRRHSSREILCRRGQDKMALACNCRLWQLGRPLYHL